MWHLLTAHQQESFLPFSSRQSLSCCLSHVAKRSTPKLRGPLYWLHQSCMILSLLPQNRMVLSLQGCLLSEHSYTIDSASLWSKIEAWSQFQCVCVRGRGPHHQEFTGHQLGALQFNPILTVPGDGAGSHRVRTRSFKTAPQLPPLQMPISNSGCHLCL